MITGEDKLVETPDVVSLWQIKHGGGNPRPRPWLVQMASGHWCPFLVSLLSNVGFCRFDKVLSNLSCWLLIWNPFCRCRRGRPGTAGHSHSLWKVRGEDGSFIHPQPLGLEVFLMDLCNSCLEDQATDIKDATKTTNLLASHSSVIDFCSFVSCSVAKVKSFFQFLKVSSEPEKSRAVYLPTSPYRYGADFSFESGKQAGFLSGILSVCFWALLRYWLRFQKNCFILWAVSTF